MRVKIVVGFANAGVVLLAVVVFYLGLGVGLQFSPAWRPPCGSRRR